MPMLAAALLACLAASRLTDALERGRGDGDASTQLRGVAPVSSTISMPVHRAQSSQPPDSKVSLPVNRHDSVSMPLQGLNKTALPTQLHAEKATEGETSSVVGDSSNNLGHRVEDVGAMCAENGFEKSSSPCKCTPFSSSWTKCSRTVPKCIFIDLGAADGNSFTQFLNGGFGPVEQCPSGQWEAKLVEANPRFATPLQQLSARFPGAVQVRASTAAYMCEATTSFYLDTHNHQWNYWGSSLSKNHNDVKTSGFEKVDVPLVNLARILQEETIPSDWVMVKMDIEGAEWDVIPCLAQAPSANLIDRLYMETHNMTLGLVGTTQDMFDGAKEVLKQRGVDIPQYFSKTF